MSADSQADYRLSGFATLGLVTNNNPHLAFRRDVTQDGGARDGSIEWKTDSLVGLQWQARWSPKFDATVQVVARDRYENSLENSVEWAFLRYRPMDGLDVRVGRLGADVFMLSDYRQVGYALPWVRPPQDFYGLLALYHYDGADINKRFDSSLGTFNLKMFYGNSDEKYPGSDETVDGVGLNFNVAGAKLSHEWNHWRWRYTYAELDLNNNIAPELTSALRSVSPLWPEAGVVSDGLNSDGKSMAYHALGAVYDNNVWWARAEAAKLSSNTLLNPGGRYYYLSAGRRLGDFTLFGLHGRARPDKAPPVYEAPAGFPSPIAEQLELLAGATTRALSNVNQKQHSWGVGGRWDFRPKMALKLQAERFFIDQTGANLWMQAGTPLISSDQTATVVSFSLDVLF